MGINLRRALALLAAAGMSASLLQGVAYAEEPVGKELSAAVQQQLVDEFVGRVHDNYQLEVKADDFQVTRDGSDILITPKGSEAPRRVKSHGVEMFELSGTVSRPSSDVHASDNPAWNPPQCMGRRNLYNPISPLIVEAWADACYQTGTITYANQVGWDAVLKQWQTCATTGNGFSYKLTGCNMAFAPVAGNPGGIDFLSWNDWDPKSTMYQNPCANVNLGVTVGGIGAQLGLNLCETLNPIKGESPLDFQANWTGYAPTGHARQTGDIISVNQTLGSGIRFNVLYGGMSARP